MDARISERRVLGVSGSYYLDFLRGFAANIVVVGHVNNVYRLSLPKFEYGQVGVAIFFLLSGYLITGSAIAKEQPKPLAGFVASRIARIMTPFLPALVIVVLVNIAFIDGYWGIDGINKGLLAFFVNAALLNDYPVMQALTHFGNFQVIRSYNTAEPFWTVAIEFWIYAFFSVVYFCLIKGTKARFVAVAIMLGLSFPVVLWNSFAGGGNGLSLVWVSGSVAAVLHRNVSHSRRAEVLIGTVMIAIGGPGLAALSMQNGFHPYDLQTLVLFAMVMFGSLFLINSSDLIARMIAFSPAFASYSYSLYLVHNTVAVLLFEKFANGESRMYWLACVAFVTSHLMAILLYIVFERHHKKVALVLRPVLERVFYPKERDTDKIYAMNRTA